MPGLLDQLGINWKLFLSQAVNFFILLLILRSFVYKPLLKIIKERNKKIQEGLDKAEEADVRLKEIDSIAKNRLKQAELESVDMIKNTEQKSKELAQLLQIKAEERQKELLKQIELNYQKQQEETKQMVMNKASELVKKIMVKTVALNPEAIDEALVKKAVDAIEHEA